MRVLRPGAITMGVRCASGLSLVSIGGGSGAQYRLGPQDKLNIRTCLFCNDFRQVWMIPDGLVFLKTGAGPAARFKRCFSFSARMYSVRLT